MKQYDLIVVGGGFAGVAASISAGREGLKVLLVEKANCLGGAASTCLVEPFMKYWTHMNGEVKKLSRGIFEEIAQTLQKMDPEIDGQSKTPGYFSEESLKLVLNRLVLDAGVEVLFNTQAVSVRRNNERIEDITLSAFGKSFTVQAEYYIDATGDANICAMAGLPYRIGREEDGLCQPMTLSFRLAHVNTKRLFGSVKREEEDPGFNRGEISKWVDTTPKEGQEERRNIQALYCQFREEGKIRNPRGDILYFRHVIDDVIHFNTTRVINMDPTDAFSVSMAEIEAREQVWEMYQFLKDNFPSFNDSKLMMTASQIGIRESRMIDGEYVLTENDIKHYKEFPDSIAVGNYDVDMHDPNGSGTSHYFFPAGKYYYIPYRCLIPKGMDNILVAGRCISVDHITQASVRIMPIVCTMGEAAGIAVYFANKNSTSVRNINIDELQGELRKKGAVID